MHDKGLSEESRAPILVKFCSSLSLHPSQKTSDSLTLSLRKTSTFSISTPQTPTQDLKLSTLQKKEKGKGMAGNQGNDIVLMGKEKLMKKIQKAEYKISKHQKRITSGVSTWVKHVILCLAFQVGFTWTLTGNRVWRCSDYFLFLGCYLVLCAFGWLQLFLTGRYYIQSVMKCDRRWRECRDLEGRLAVLKGSSRVQDFDDGHQCHIVLGIMALLCVASCVLAMFILFLEAFSGNLAVVCRGN